MSAHDQDHRQAWDSLTTVEDHPAVEEWLRQIDHAGPKSERSRRPFVAVAATVVAVLALGSIAYVHLSPKSYDTYVGEQRDVLLPDGSRMTLNTNTRVTVRYSKKRRWIDLKRGEALFVVKHDERRPFDVSAGGTLTTALGTQFNVDLRNSNVTVSVLDGVVQVAAVTTALDAAKSAASPGGNAEMPHMATIRPALFKGEAVEVRTHERQVVAEKADLRRIDAWRTRKLEFSDTPLAEAVEEFNRYSDRPVVVGSRQLESVRVSGVFNIGDEEGFLFSLREALQVQVLQSGGVVTLVAPASVRQTLPGPSL